jgi:nitrite reductase/ring-hydroxylating ferredoxin subunit
MGEQHEERAAAGAAGRFVEVGLVEGLPPCAAFRAAIGGMDVSVVNVEGRIFAVGDLCLRCGGSLAAGRTCGMHLTCSACGWRYDLGCNCVVGLPALRIETHEVRVEAGRIFVAEGTLPPPAS